MKLYFSSACIRNSNILEVINKFKENGINNIELSAGTKYNENIEKELFLILKNTNINLCFHNYFPIPEKKFILNLASLNDYIYQESINLCLNSIKLSKKLGIKTYSVHAGFFLDFGIKEIGKTIHRQELFDKKKSINRFVNAWNILKKEANNQIDLYIENNVLTKKNYDIFNFSKPFMLLDSEDYKYLNNLIDFKLLLDLAHLKVSSKTLKLNFLEEINFLFSNTNYIHYSENNGLVDQNKGLNLSNQIFKILNHQDLSNKTITVEVYESMEDLIYIKDQFLTL
jgi:sugar phosphate isomerase/epimerase